MMSLVSTALNCDVSDVRITFVGAFSALVGAAVATVSIIFDYCSAHSAYKASCVPLSAQ